MAISFESLAEEHRIPVMDIFNYYIENSFAAYPDKTLGYEFFDKITDNTKGYPAYAIKSEEKIIGFCYLSAYNPLPSFKKTAQITYFIANDFIGKGIGTLALKRLEDDARNVGVDVLLAHISSLNSESIKFHLKNGFRECGRFENIITKHNRSFDIIWLQKNI